MSSKYWKNIIPLLDFVLRVTAGKNELIVIDTIVEHDYWIFLADLTYIFNIHFKNWLPFYTYIKPNEEYVEIWKERLKPFKNKTKIDKIAASIIPQEYLQTIS